MDIVSKSAGLANALNTASGGVQKSSRDFSEAAKATTDSFAASANELSASFNEEITLDSSTYLSSQNTSDPLFGIMDMKLAEHAYKANLEVMKTTDEMMEDAIDRLA
ncbi:MAG: hypothetical protein OSB62_05850 [Alphaproteobacteria bacterium]|nr:hypothetical protein [Alphaproteobacteria bacterium]